MKVILIVFIVFVMLFMSIIGFTKRTNEKDMIFQYITKKTNNTTLAATITNAIYQHKNTIPAWLIVFLIEKESSFNPYVYGESNEIGLMQITDDALADVLGKQKNDITNEERQRLWDIDYNIKIGCKYLKLAKRYVEYYTGKSGWYWALYWYKDGHPDNWDNDTKEYADWIWEKYIGTTKTD
jgi:soluble lytic murein transglycosylase-like protein